jgi:3-methyladenine DNA glycosylase AlkD
VSATIEERVAAVLDELRASGSPARAKHSTAVYHPTSLEVFGVPVPAMRSIAARLARELRDAPAADVLAFAQALVDSRNFDARQVAYELILRQREAFRTLKTDTIEALGAGNDNWASVDAFATGLAGPAWRAGLLSDRRIARWARAPDPWWRRTALASTVALNRITAGPDGDPARTLPICALLVEDRHDMVVKALSWALRSLATRDPDAVRAFLEEHAADLVARVRREVRHKLETGYKHRPRAREGRG